MRGAAEPAQSFRVICAHGADLTDWIAPTRTALLIIDMQVDFAAPDGALGRAGLDLSGVPNALAAAGRLARAARGADVPVLFAALRTQAGTDSPVWRERVRRRGGDPDFAMALCRLASPGATFIGPLPEPGEMVIAKTRYSAFFRTVLDSELRATGVDTLVVCGLTTESCVDSTVRDAFHLDYHVFLAGDACAAYGEDLHAAALKSLELNCAILVTADEIVRTWEEDRLPAVP